MGMMNWFCLGLGMVVGLVLDSYCTIVQILACVAILLFVMVVWHPADCDAVLWLCEYFGRPPEHLKGQVAWITGASSGIGRALAVRMARAGVKLALSARNVEALHEVRKLCIGTGGVGEEEVLVVPLDLLQHQQHQQAFDTILKHFNQLDILVSNAGRSQRAQWEKISTEVDRELFELNVFSLIHLARLTTTYFMDRGHGHHVINSSVAGKIGAPTSGSYTASKHALQGYFETLRMEHRGSGVDITLVCPGPVESNIIKSVFTEKIGQGLGDEERKGKLMSGERCAELMAVAMANKLPEVWITQQPILAIMYLVQYLPFFFFSGFKYLPINPSKLRDGRDDLKKTE